MAARDDNKWRYYAPYEPRDGQRVLLKGRERLDFSECDKAMRRTGVFAVEDFGRALQQEMWKLGCTQIEIVRRAKVGRSNFSRYVNGEWKPSEGTWKKIKAAMLEIQANRDRSKSQEE